MSSGARRRAAVTLAAATPLLLLAGCASSHNSSPTVLIGPSYRKAGPATAKELQAVLDVQAQSITDADWRSIARCSDCGNDCRVASRSKSCRNLNCAPSSTKRSARTASSTAEDPSQPTMPADDTSTSASALVIKSRKTPSAMGERQMLPVQTKRTEATSGECTPAPPALRGVLSRATGD